MYSLRCQAFICETVLIKKTLISDIYYFDFYYGQGLFFIMIQYKKGEVGDILDHN